MNKAFITGRLTDEIQLRKTNSNKSVCEFSLACSRGAKDQSGKPITDFINVTCWEQRADFLSSYAHKGTMVGVCGRIETQSYDKNGERRYRTLVVAEQVEILGEPKSQPTQNAYDSEASSHRNNDYQTVLNDGHSDMFGHTDNFIESKDLPFY